MGQVTFFRGDVLPASCSSVDERRVSSSTTVNRRRRGLVESHSIPRSENTCDNPFFTPRSRCAELPSTSSDHVGRLRPSSRPADAAVAFVEDRHPRRVRLQPADHSFATRRVYGIAVGRNKFVWLSVDGRDAPSCLNPRIGRRWEIRRGTRRSGREGCGRWWIAVARVAQHQGRDNGSDPDRGAYLPSSVIFVRRPQTEFDCLLSNDPRLPRT